MPDIYEVRQHIEIRQGISGLKPVIAGHRIRVVDIVVMHEDQGHTPAEIVELLPTITLADVHAALAFYWDNKEAFDRWFDEEEKFVEEMRSTHVSPLERKLSQRKGA
jgi:uncharacterized protein (DUF433 family)